MSCCTQRSYAVPRLFRVQRHLILCSVSFLLTHPSEACGTQLPPKCFTLRVQHLFLRAASYSDAADRLERFEVLAVSQPLHDKTEYQK